MASNPTPDDDDVLLALAEDLADGCHLHEVSIGIKQNTETVIRAAIGAAVGTNQALGAAEVLAGAKGDLHRTADEAGGAVLKNCRLWLLKLLGTQYNAGWGEAGWPNQSTAVPNTQDERFSLLGAIKVYFTAHPTSESVDMEATAALCNTGHEALSNARAALNAAEAALTDAKRDAAAVFRTLRKRVRGLIEELGTLVADDDARYEAFGLNIPANPSAPEAIAGVTLTALGAGRVLVQWPYATRSTGVRVLRKRVGVDTEFATVGTSAGLEKVLTGQTVGQVLEIEATAYNDGGDAAPSPVASVTVT